MRVLVVGVGLQGRAVVHDLERAAAVTGIIAADLDVRAAATALERLGCPPRPTALSPVEGLATGATLPGPS
ncbi:MAG: hypothetical protein HY907_05370 [Deltaproteobacteria bacterium]|nr:hypothetical protein [Deltaproteobacteria bacterium]